MLVCDKVVKVIADFPNLSKIWDREYVNEDCQNRFRHPWLSRLAEDPDEEITYELGKLNSYLCMIASFKGFDKLLPGLKAHDIEYFTSTVAEVKTNAWIASYHKLAEIRPLLPNGNNGSDFIFTLDGQSIYGEVWEPRDLLSSKVSNDPIPIYLTDQKTEQPKRERTLRQKGYLQLPSNVIGIWVAHIYHAILTTTFIDTFIQDMASRLNVLGTVLWVRAGSNRFPFPCIPCRGLANEDHDIYWLGNNNCEYTYLQRKLLYSIEIRY